MEPAPQTDSGTVSCDTLIEFDELNVVGTEAEFAVRPPAPSGPTLANGQLVPGARPSAKDVAAAKKMWLPIIRRCTEPVSGNKGRLRPVEAESPTQGRIVIDYQRGPRYGQYRGSEVDISDKMFLLLFDREPAGPKSVIESTIPVLWTDIINIRFEIERPMPEPQEA
jgi:hypothetical protein